MHNWSNSNSWYVHPNCAYDPSYRSSDCTQVSTIEFSLVEVSVLHGLKTGSEVLKQINKEMNLEAVEKLLEETREARAHQEVCWCHPDKNR